MKINFKRIIPTALLTIVPSIVGATQFDSNIIDYVRQRTEKQNLYNVDFDSTKGVFNFSTWSENFDSLKSSKATTFREVETVSQIMGIFNALEIDDTTTQKALMYRYLRENADSAESVQLNSLFPEIRNNTIIGWRYKQNNNEGFIPGLIKYNGHVQILNYDNLIDPKIIPFKIPYEVIAEAWQRSLESRTKTSKPDTVRIFQELLKREPVMFLGVNGFTSRNAYGLDFVLDINEKLYGMRHSEGDVSWLLHFGASHDKVRRDSYESKPLGRNQRYLYQEREVKTDGLIPRLGVGVSLNSNSGIGGEFSVIRELFRDYIERVNEEVRNPGGSLYKVNENYVKYTKGKSRTLLYSGVRYPLDKKRNWYVRAGIQFGKDIKPQCSAGISKSIWSKQKK